MFIEKVFYEFYKNEMYGIYAKCIFPIITDAINIGLKV